MASAKHGRTLQRSFSRAPARRVALRRHPCGAPLGAPPRASFQPRLRGLCQDAMTETAPEGGAEGRGRETDPAVSLDSLPAGRTR